MSDTLSLSALSSSALTEGIKFLYGQVAELLRYRRDRAQSQQQQQQLPTQQPALAGQLQPLHADAEALAELRPHLLDLRRTLADYADEIAPADPANQLLLETVDALRQSLEAVYGQRITFLGENRPTSGPVVEGTIDLSIVAGYAAAVRAQSIAGSAHVLGQIRAGAVTEGGQVVAIEANEIT